jgi:hypothetical protein
MIDIKKALSQRCYIIFDSNEQLVKFVDENKLKVLFNVWNRDITLSINTNGIIETHSYKPKDGITTYHHTELTITDDGE